MKKIVIILCGITYILSSTLIFNMYNREKSGIWVVITVFVLFIHSLLLFIQNRKISFKKNVKLWILICLWFLFIFKVFFNAPIQLFLVAYVVIQVLYFFIDDYLNGDKTGDNNTGCKTGQSGDQSGDGSVIEP